MRRTIILLVTLCFPLLSLGLTLPLPPPGNDVVGRVQVVTAEPGDTLHTIGRRFDIGYYEMVEANRNLNPKKPLKKWTKVIIPSEYVLPKAPRRGIVINLAELRLYYYPPGRHVVETFPVGIGREGWETPTGTAKIMAKIKNPTWTVPESVRLDSATRGQMLPKSIPPGPDNPLGKFAMRTSFTAILIHGTNNPTGVGMRSSAGCLRMFPEDIANLFKQTRVGTPLHVVDQAFKSGWVGRYLYLEAHQPLQEQEREFGSGLTPMVKLVMSEVKNRKANIDWDAAVATAEQQNGIPTRIGGLSLSAYNKRQQKLYGVQNHPLKKLSLAEDLASKQ